MKLSYFNLARKASKRSPSKIKMGCVVVNKKMVSLGWNNMTRTHPKAETYGNYLHAELHALLRTEAEFLKGSEVYVYRETKTGQPANSRPCSVCYKALNKAQVRRICFIEDGIYTWEDVG